MSPTYYYINITSKAPTIYHASPNSCSANQQSPVAGFAIRAGREALICRKAALDCERAFACMRHLLWAIPHIRKEWRALSQHQATSKQTTYLAWNRKERAQFESILVRDSTILEHIHPEWLCLPAPTLTIAHRPLLHWDQAREVSLIFSSFENASTEDEDTTRYLETT